MKKYRFVVAVLLSAAGCAAESTKVDYLASEAYQDRAQMTHSLFPQDQAVLSNDAIEQILGAKVVLPGHARIAVLRMGQRYYLDWWSDEFAEAEQALVSDFLTKLRGCRRIADASLLPSMLVPGKQTIPNLREAAARFQADLLLVYRTESQTFQKERLLASDEVRASCIVEAVLLETRSGIVPFASVAVQQYTAKKSREELELAETVRKARLKAIGLAMDRIATDLVSFLEAVP
jgi:hypothetical protein